MLFSEDCRRLWDFALGNSTSRAQWDSEQGLKISYILTSIIEFKIFWKSFPQGQCIEAMVREGPRLHLSWKLDPVMCKPPMWYWFWRHEKVVRSNWGLALREARRSPGEGAALVAQEIPGYQRFLWPWDDHQGYLLVCNGARACLSLPDKLCYGWQPWRGGTAYTF